MKVLNLSKVSGIKRKRLIADYCGGAYSYSEAYAFGGIGVGGIHYVGGIDVIDNDMKGDHLKCNTETLKDGLGIYLREDSNNYLLLLKKSEILSIHFDKEYDQIKDKATFSLFKFCLNNGIPYYYAKYMLMEDEIINLNKPKLKIITTALDEINFECSRRNPMKVIKYFKNSPFDVMFEAEYNDFKLVF